MGVCVGVIDAVCVAVGAGGVEVGVGAGALMQASMKAAIRIRRKWVFIFELNSLQSTAFWDHLILSKWWKSSRLSKEKGASHDRRHIHLRKNIPRC